jgi:hypothetical protein
VDVVEKVAAVLEVEGFCAEVLEAFSVVLELEGF